MAHYLKVKSVKRKVYEFKKQISPDGLRAIDGKIDDFLERVCATSKKRINADVVACINIK